MKHGNEDSAKPFAIVVPSYNCEHYVADTLNSLLAQAQALTRCACLILTDDCSTDRTVDVARSVWAGAPIPLIVFEAEKNRGEYRNMNECIARLPPYVEWYAVMHADNMAKAGWLTTLLDTAERADPKIASICTSWDTLFEDGTVVEGENRTPADSVRVEANGRTIADTIIQGCWWHISSCITRTIAYREVGGLPHGLRLKGDWEFLLRLLRGGWDIEYLPRSLMLYRMNPQGSSSISFRLHRDIRETLAVMQRFQRSMTVRQMTAYHLGMLKTLLRRGLGGVVRGHFARALHAVPTAVHVSRSWIKCLWARMSAHNEFVYASEQGPPDFSLT